MMQCMLCKDVAVYKDVVPLMKNGQAHYLCYCRDHAQTGVAFGFLERSELQKL